MLKIIPANGDGQRFKDAGYETPKHLLTLGGTTVIATIAAKLPAGGALRCLTRREYLNRTATELAPFGSVVGLREKRGPLGDVLQLPAIPDDQELLINYCDCWMDSYDPFLSKVRNMNFDAGVVVFHGRDERHTQLIPGIAFGGIYWFRTGALFKEKAKLVNPDSSVLAVAILCDYTIHMSYNYTDVGVPEDYEHESERIYRTGETR